MSGPRLAGWPPGTTALVTGASSGIGRAVATRLSAAGHRLVLVGRDPTGLDDVAAETGGLALPADLADAGAAHRIADAGGPVDLLVCNAGAGAAGPFTEMDSDDVAALFRLNMSAVVELVHALLPGMLERRRGHIVVIASVAGRLPVREEVAYGATKAAVDQFAAGLRLEVADRGVGVSTIAPAGVATEFFDRRGVPYRRRMPRLLGVDTVADAVVRAIEHDLPEIVVPRWLRVAYVVRAAAPRLYDRLTKRFD